MATMSQQQRTETIDQLQAQVNLVLEHTGRIFAAVNANPKTPPAVQINKLKLILPPATNRFHSALDRLESELQLAQLVLRRDLAVLRESSGHHPQGVPAQQAGLPVADAQPEAIDVSSETATDSKPAEVGSPSADQDVAMEDVEQEDQKSADPVVEEPAAHASKADQDPSPLEPVASDSKVAHGSEPTSEPIQPPLTSETSQALDNVSVDARPPPLDTAATVQPGEDEQPPDTAVGSTAGDLDSLFNDAGGDSASVNFNFDQNNAADEIDFADFGNFNSAENGDNDNISTILPGLEDYAKAQSTASNAELDLNAFFGSTGDENNGMNNQGAVEPGDTTFEDLMDLNFETGLDGDGNNNANEHLDFDALFD